MHFYTDQTGLSGHFTERLLLGHTLSSHQINVNHITSGQFPPFT